MPDTEASSLRPLLWTAAVMLVLAVPPVWPYWYYVLLRLVVCGAGAYGAYVAHRSDASLLVPFALIALLFNPLIPVHLPKVLWAALDLATAAFLIYSARGLGRSWAVLTERSDHGDETGPSS
jgi:hypothetical protein